MKKYHYLTLLLVAASCSTDEPKQEPDLPPLYQTATRSISEAVSLANSFAEASANSRGEVRKARVANVEIIGSSSSRSDGDTLIYAVNYDDNAGYALVSSAREGQPILAYVEKGQYSSEELQSNDGLAFFIENAKDYVSTMSSFIGDSIGSTIKPQPKPYTIQRRVEPVLTVKWGQHFPEGLLCPNGTSGCNQTAAVQILSYFEQPTTITLTYPERDINSLSLNWSDIKRHKRSYNSSLSYDANKPYCPASNDAHLALARLCREIGYRSNAIYNSGGSTDAAPTVTRMQLKNLLPSRTISEFFTLAYSKDFLFDKLQEKAIAYIAGWESADYSSGHSWVCEGGREYEYHSGRLQYTGEEYVTFTYYFYFNWGDNGYSNGYFLGDVYDTSKGLDESQLPTDGEISALSRANDFKYHTQYFTVK